MLSAHRTKSPPLTLNPNKGHFKQQLPAITQQFFQGNIFMTIAVTLPTIAVDPTRPERQQHIARERTDRADGLFSVFRVLRGLIFVSREWSRV